MKDIRDIRDTIKLIESLSELSEIEYEDALLDVFDSDTIIRYSAGLCHVLAFALQDCIPEKTDIVVIYDFDLDIESEVITHVVVKYKDYFIDISNITKSIDDIASEYEDLGEQEIVVNNDRESICELAGEFSSQEYNDAKKVATKICDILFVE